MGGIEVEIALESWLFRFGPCSVQGQFTLTIQSVGSSEYSEWMGNVVNLRTILCVGSVLLWAKWWHPVDWLDDIIG